MSTPNPLEGATFRKVIVEPAGGDDGLLILDYQTGRIVWKDTPERAYAFIKAVDEAAAKRGESTITVIDWRGMPEGFTPPGEQPQPREEQP
jgi:hypothetical protein